MDIYFCRYIAIRLASNVKANSTTQADIFLKSMDLFLEFFITPFMTEWIILRIIDLRCSERDRITMQKAFKKHRNSLKEITLS